MSGDDARDPLAEHRKLHLGVEDRCFPMHMGVDEPWHRDAPISVDHLCTARWLRGGRNHRSDTCIRYVDVDSGRQTTGRIG